LSNSTLNYTGVRGDYSMGNIIIENNKLISSRINCNYCGVERNNVWNHPNAGSIDINNNIMDRATSIEFQNHKLKSIKINKNQFINHSQGIRIYPHWAVTYLGYSWARGSKLNLLL
jgi:hypothetical protein